jgi:hypothetical protein
MSRVRDPPGQNKDDWFDELTDAELDEAFKQEPLCRIKFELERMAVLSKRELRQLMSVIAINHDRFADDNKDPGASHKLELDIRLQPGAEDEPVAGKSWRRGPETAKIINDHVEQMLDAGHIERSNSRWAANVVLVSKKDGSLRFAISYKGLSEKILYAPWPIPNVQDALDSLGGSKFFSLVDFCSAYFQLPLTPRSKLYTAFKTPDGLYHFCRAPFGLSLLPHEWAKAVDICMGGLRYKCVQIFFDDFLIHSKTFEDHLRDIHSVMGRLRDFGFALKAEKCEFIRKVFEYLGHLVTAEGVTPAKSKLKAVQDVQAGQP